MLITVFCERSNQYIIDSHFSTGQNRKFHFRQKPNCIPRIPSCDWWVCLLTKNVTKEFWACICMTCLKFHLDGLLVENENVVTLFLKPEISNICKAYTFLCFMQFWCGFFFLWIYWTDNFLLSSTDFLFLVPFPRNRQAKVANKVSNCKILTFIFFHLHLIKKIYDMFIQVIH